jgi:hypothetical protein
MPMSKIEWEILNATADDGENLEQIYQMLCFDFSPDNYANRDQGAYYWRSAPGTPSLTEVADRICALTEAGLLAARHGDTGAPVSDLSDRSYVWRAWFVMTPSGRSAWDSSEYATLAEQEQPQ